MSLQQIPDPSLDGSIWGTSPMINRSPDIRFFYCDPKTPRTPSHVWWDGVALAIDQSVFHRYPEMVLSSDDYMRSGFGELQLIHDSSSSLSVEDLEQAQARARAQTEGNP